MKGENQSHATKPCGVRRGKERFSKNRTKRAVIWECTTRLSLKKKWIAKWVNGLILIFG